ncbi:MAG: hypothetical protein ACX98W_19840, partial [bacterium]
MSRRTLGIILLWALILGGPMGAANGRAEELRIDGFESGQTAVLQLGLAIGDILAVRLVPTGPCPCRVTGVKYLLGTQDGGSLIGEMDIHIWDDPGGSQLPGPEIFQGRIAPTSDNENFFLTDVEPEEIIVDGPFRVGLEIVIPEQIDPVEPSLFRDSDGTLTPLQNFVFDANSQAWFYSELFAVPGDWIIRAIVEPVSANPVPGLSDRIRAGVVACL